MPYAATSSLSNENQYLADSLEETIDQLHKLKEVVLASAPGPDREAPLDLLERHLVSTCLFICLAFMCLMCSVPSPSFFLDSSRHPPGSDCKEARHRLGGCRIRGPRHNR